MKKKVYQRTLVLSVLLLLWSALVPCVASSQQDSTVIPKKKLFDEEAGSAFDNFGSAVAVDGNILAVGVPFDDDGVNNSGSVYLISYTDGDIGRPPSEKLTEKDGAQSDDSFGNSLAISGSTIVIGASKDDINGTNSGAAYIYEFSYDESQNAWDTEEVAQFTGAQGGVEFGHAVAISGDVVVVGAHQDSDKGLYAGAVYVFRNNGSTWIREAKLYSSDAQTQEYFGSSVAIDGDTIAVGAIGRKEEGSKTGSVFVFTYDGSTSTWGQEAELLGGDLGASDKFGFSVALEGDTLIVGAPYQDGVASNTGAAYVFRRNGNTWYEEDKLIGSGLSLAARFGNSVALSGNIAVVGAFKNDIFDGDNNVMMEEAGSAYLFRYEGDVWNEKERLERLFAKDAGAGDELGCAVAISGHLVVVGANRDDVEVKGNPEYDAGSAYVFTLNQPPVADAGEDLEVEEGSQVELDGSQSFDPDDDDTLEYLWTQTGGPPVELGTTNEEMLTFTAPSWSAENEKLTFRLEVKDESQATSFDDVEITLLQSTTNVTEINSVLDWERRPWGIDKDMYTFYGSRGDKVIVTLRAKTGGKNKNGDRATLKLKDNIRGVNFYRVDSSRLPNKICTTLPATGQYHILVAGQRRLLRGKGFSGEYTLSLEGASGNLEKGAGTPVVQNKPGCSAKSHKQQHPVWDWISSWFRH